MDFVWLGAGTFLYVFVSWKWNLAIAAWAAPVFLLKFTRGRRTWYAALLAYPPLILASFLKFSGTWGDIIGPVIETAVSAILPLPLVAALLADRAFRRRLPAALAPLIFPAVYVCLDFIFSHIPSFGAAGSMAVTQFYATPLLQILPLTGIWGVSFLITWTASSLAAWWENGFPIEKAALPALAAPFAAGLLLIAGSLRLNAFSPDARTVKVGGIAVPMEQDYWERILDRAAPREEAPAFKDELARLERTLLQRSEAAANGGAKVIVWSEANLFLYEEDLPAFLARARQFAVTHQVYFAPSLQVLHYGSSINDNRNLMITPQGETAYSYTKRMTLYRSDADGIIRFVDTPYGRIGSAICFDMDFPGYVRQAGKKAIDIMLVPAYDTKGGSPFHSYVGIERAPENGFSVFRSVSHGTSLAVDYQGRVLGRQNYFTAGGNIFFADLPIKGVRTPYAYIGDWLAAASLLFLLGAALYAVLNRRRAKAGL